MSCYPKDHWTMNLEKPRKGVQGSSKIAIVLRGFQILSGCRINNKILKQIINWWNFRKEVGIVPMKHLWKEVSLFENPNLLSIVESERYRFFRPAGKVINIEYWVGESNHYDISWPHGINWINSPSRRLSISLFPCCCFFLINFNSSQPWFPFACLNWPLDVVICCRCFSCKSSWKKHRNKTWLKVPTLLGTITYPIYIPAGTFESMIFLFPRWDMWSFPGWYFVFWSKWRCEVVFAPHLSARKALERRNRTKN